MLRIGEGFILGLGMSCSFENGSTSLFEASLSVGHCNWAGVVVVLFIL